MVFHNPLVAQSDEDRALELQLAEKQVAKMWQDYLRTFPRKSEIINDLSPHIQYQVLIHELESLITVEFSQLSKAAIKDEDLVSDLFKFGHDERLGRLVKLESQLCHAATKYEYVHQLMAHLLAILKVELELLDSLERNPSELSNVIAGLQQQLQLESEVVRQINQRPTFTEMFITLIRDEHVIHRLSDNEKRASKLLNSMRLKLQGFIGPSDNLLFAWTDIIKEKLVTKINELLENDALVQDINVDYEFVNSPAFEELAHEALIIARQKGGNSASAAKSISPDTLKAFVVVYRNWYNHEFNGRNEILDRIFS